MNNVAQQTSAAPTLKPRWQAPRVQVLQVDAANNQVTINAGDGILFAS